MHKTYVKQDFPEHSSRVHRQEHIQAVIRSCTEGAAIQARITIERSRSLLITWGKYSVRRSASEGQASNQDPSREKVSTMCQASCPRLTSAITPASHTIRRHSTQALRIWLVSWHVPLANVAYAVCSWQRHLSAPAETTRITFYPVISNRMWHPSLNTYHRKSAVQQSVDTIQAKIPIQYFAWLTLERHTIAKKIKVLPNSASGPSRRPSRR